MQTNQQNSLQKKWYTVAVFARLNTRRFFRDRLALFFGILFPLIFLFIFGGIFGRSGSGTSFKVALINNSDTAIAKEYVDQAKDSKLLKVDKEITTMDAAKEKMNRSQLDAALIGHTAERVLEAVDCDLLVIKPPTFSPA